MKKYLKSVVFLIPLFFLANAHGATVINNSAIVNVSVSTSAAYNKLIDLGVADSASFQMTMTCAEGILVTQQSNDGVNFVNANIAGSSMTFVSSSTSTISNQLFSIASPPYRYLNFNIVNSSAPVAGPAVPCSAVITTCIKSLTVTSN